MARDVIKSGTSSKGDYSFGIFSIFIIKENDIVIIMILNFW